LRPPIKQRKLFSFHKARRLFQQKALSADVAS